MRLISKKTYLFILPASFVLGFLLATSFTTEERLLPRAPMGRKKELIKMVRDLEKDPFQPHLKYHHLGGKFKGKQSVSITDDYRITMTIVITEKEIQLLDIGPHDKVYR